MEAAIRIAIDDFWNERELALRRASPTDALQKRKPTTATPAKALPSRMAKK
jgi:hypothetical protein